MLRTSVVRSELVAAALAGLSALAFLILVPNHSINKAVEKFGRL
jgi:hypothetical protein